MKNFSHKAEKTYIALGMVFIYIFCNIFLNYLDINDVGLYLVSLVYVSSLLIFIFERSVLLALLPGFLYLKTLLFAIKYDPLGEIDAVNFYRQATDGTLSDTIISIFRLIAEGGFLFLIEFAGLIYKFIIAIVGTNDPIALAFVNHLLILFSGLLLCRCFPEVLMYRSKIFGSYLLAFSPLIGKYGTYLYKEAIVIFIITTALYLYKKNHKIYRVLAFLLIILATLLRPYSILIFMTFFVASSGARGLIGLLLIGASFVLLSGVIVYFDGNLIDYIIDIILATFALIGSPNFLRAGTWQDEPWLAAESFFLSIAFLLICIKIVRTQRFLKLIVVMSLFGTINGAVSYQRLLTLDDNSEIKPGSLLSDDMSRKKLPAQYFTVFYILYLLQLRSKKGIDDDHGRPPQINYHSNHRALRKTSDFA